MTVSTLQPWNVASDANALEFTIRRMLGQATFIELVIVEGVDTAAKTVQVKQLVKPVDAAGNPIEAQSVYSIPFFRLQMGNSAIIINPAVGDFGLMLVCDEDISNVKANKSAAMPAHEGRHARASGIYLGGIALMNGSPTEYLEFTGSGINLVAPKGLKIIGDTEIEGAVTTTSTITAKGEITGNGIALSSHVHSGVESGGSDTGKPA